MFKCIINIDLLGLLVLLYQDNFNINEANMKRVIDRKMKDNFNITTSVNYGVVSFSS